MTVTVVTAVFGHVVASEQDPKASTGRIDAISQYMPQEHASGAVAAGGGGPPDPRARQKGQILAKSRDLTGDQFTVTRCNR